jgi:hypothetical protein
VEESVSDSFDDQRYDSANRFAQEAAEQVGLDWDDLSGDDQDSIKEAIYDKDESDPVRALLRNTGSQLIRASLAKPSELLVRSEGMDDPAFGQHSLNSADPRGRQARIDAVNSALSSAGADIADAETAEAVEELIDNGPWDWHEGVTLDVIFYTPIGDASAAPQSDTDAPGSIGRDIVLTGARVVLLDPWNGSGHDVAIPGKLTTRVTPGNPATLDSEAAGYGWDHVAGVVKSAYAPESVNSTWVVPAE